MCHVFMWCVCVCVTVCDRTHALHRVSAVMFSNRSSDRLRLMTFEINIALLCNIPYEPIRTFISKDATAVAYYYRPACLRVYGLYQATVLSVKPQRMQIMTS